MPDHRGRDSLMTPDENQKDREKGTPGPWFLDSDNDIAYDATERWLIACPRWPDHTDTHITWDQCHAAPVIKPRTEPRSQANQRQELPRMEGALLVLSLPLS